MKTKIFTIWEWLILIVGIQLLLVPRSDLAAAYSKHDFWCGFLTGIGPCLMLFVVYKSRMRQNEAKKQNL